MPAGRPGKLIAAGSGLCLTLAACSAGGGAAQARPSPPARSASHPPPAVMQPPSAPPAVALQITPRAVSAPVADRA